MDHIDDETVFFIPRWFVLFQGGDDRRFVIDLLTEPGFRHCMAFGFDAVADRWLVYDVTRIGTCIVALHPDNFPDWLMAMKARGGRVLQVDVQSPPRNRAWIIAGLMCVSAIIHLTGARSSAWRPRALWRDLVRAGAVEVFANGLVADR